MRCHVIGRRPETGEYYLRGSGFSHGRVPTTNMMMVRLDGERTVRPMHVELAAQLDPHGYVRRMNQQQKEWNV